MEQILSNRDKYTRLVNILVGRKKTTVTPKAAGVSAVTSCPTAVTPAVAIAITEHTRISQTRLAKLKIKNKVTKDV